jgi:hypothetical protein
MANRQRKQTFADDFQGEIDRIDGVPSGGCRRRRLRSFAGDFATYIRRADGRR